MVGTAERQALKRAALLALDESRGALSSEIRRVRTRWNPRQLMRRGMERHKIALAVTAALVGLGVTRLFMMPRKERGSGSSLRGKITGLAVTALWSIFQEPLLDFAKSHFASYLDKHHQSPNPDKPE